MTKKLLISGLIMLVTGSGMSQTKQFATGTPVTSNDAFNQNVTDAALAADTNLATKARITSPPSASRYIELVFNAPVAANTPVYVKIDMQDNQLPALLGGALSNLVSDALGGVLGGQNIRIQAKSGTAQVVLDSNQSLYSGYTNQRLKVVRDAGGSYFVMIIPNAAFDRIRITNTVPVISTSKWVDVYGAYYLDGAQDCGIANYTSFSGAGLLNVATTGVYNAHYAIDDDISNYSSLNLGLLGVGTYVEQTVYFEGSSAADDVYTAKFKISPALVQLGLLNNIQIISYNEGSETGTINLSSLISADLLGLLNNDQPVSVSFTPGAADMVTLRLSGLVNASTSQNLDLYGIIRGSLDVNLSGGGIAQLNEERELTTQVTGCTGPYTYWWAGVSSTTATAVPPTDTAGTFNYSVTVTDRYGIQQTAETELTVVAPPVAGTASSAATVCPGTAAVLTLVGFTGNIQWQQSEDGVTGWADVTGGTGATTSTCITPLLNSGTFYYRAQVSNVTYPSVFSNTISVSVTEEANWTGAVSTDWNTPGNWECEIVPTLALNANILISPGGNYPLIDGEDGPADCKNITIDNGASVVVSGNGEGTLRMAGAITNNGTLNVANGTLVMAGEEAQVIPANALTGNVMRNLTINNPEGVTLAGNANLTGILTLTNGLFDTGNALTLKSSTAATAMVAEVTGSITGTMVIERYIPARRAFRFIASPVNGGSIRANWQEGGANVTGLGTDITGAGGIQNGFDPSGSNNPSMFVFNNIPRTWTAVTSTLTNNLQAGAPYRLMVRGDRTINQFENDSAPTITTLRSTGTIVTGNVVFSTFSQNAGDLNLIGNPYQAPVDMAEMLAEANNVNPAFYTVWDPTLGGNTPTSAKGAYVTVDLLEDTNSNPASVANRFLYPNQACFVQTLANGAASVTFKESHKNLLTNSTPNLYRASGGEPAAIKLQLFDTMSLQPGYMPSDGLVIRFSDSFSNGVDAYDAIKMPNEDEDIATLNTGTKLSIEKRSMPLTEDVIPLVTDKYRKESYTLSATVTGLDNGLTAYLYDTLKQTYTKLRNDYESFYSFTVKDAKSAAADRFRIIFSEKSLNSEDFDNNTAKLYPNPSGGGMFYLSVAPEWGSNVTVKIYNTIGQEVKSHTSVTSDTVIEVRPDFEMAAGVYLVHISANGMTTIKELIIG
jgi:hypothetical protein